MAKVLSLLTVYLEEGIERWGGRQLESESALAIAKRGCGHGFGVGRGFFFSDGRKRTDKIEDVVKATRSWTSLPLYPRRAADQWRNVKSKRFS